MQHPCEVCGKPATHKFTKIVHGEIQERFLCDEHALQTESYLVKSNLQVSLEQLLASLFKQAQEGGEAGEAAGTPDMRCGVCGLPFSAYRKTMILGCDRCYESFEDQLRHDIRKIHGSLEHKGRRPANYVPPEKPARAVPIVPVGEAAAPLSDEEKALPPPPTESTPEQEALTLPRLKARMRAAVEAEDFEEAARLRDKIRALESKE